MTRKMIWLFVSVLWLPACGPHLVLKDVGVGLVFCIPPVVDAGGAQRPLDTRFPADMRQISSPEDAQGCDVIVNLKRGETRMTGGGIYSYQERSAYSGTALSSDDMGDLYDDGVVLWLSYRLRNDFNPGTANYQRIATEKRKVSGVGQRQMFYPPPERQQQIDAAEREGDAARSGGDLRTAFAAYTRALTGGVFDDETSRRVRDIYMALIGNHPELLPPVPEDARRHMVRANAILKNSQDFAAYDDALREMAAAIGTAPWWSEAYYNAALVCEKAGYLDDAMSALKLYLAANPRAQDARAIQDKIYALEVRQERGGKH